MQALVRKSSRESAILDRTMLSCEKIVTFSQSYSILIPDSFAKMSFATQDMQAWCWYQVRRFLVKP